MVELKNIKNIYFIGIGGIGMSALARYFRFHGAEVGGYDKTATDLTRQLEKEGIAVHYQEDIGLIPKSPDLVVFTPAVPGDHKELSYYRNLEVPVLKRSDVLGLITAGSFNICVAGTHGKTTITTMIAHILRHSGYGCNAFLGGIAVNYDSNFWSDEKNVCVVEADEYDRSFLKLNPDIAVITAMDADHLDIYGTAEAVQDAFIEFSGKLKPGGLLLSKFGLERSREFTAAGRQTYSLENDSADNFSQSIVIRHGSYQFDTLRKDWRLDGVELNMGGMHNVENVTAAIAVAHHLGIDNMKIKDAVAAFRGVKRRFEYIIKTSDRILIDDYAHHPEELKALISSARTLFPGMNCTVIFQPHLYSRTRDLADGFAKSLDLADEVLLLPIYPAREQPIEEVNSEMIARRMKKGKATVCSKNEALAIVEDRILYNDNLDLLITAGAGDIDALVGPLKKIIEKGH
ncbi:MAG: UDP-N-acetylmuramate--L-alanine ligase [Puia sp.]|nr:UDP-N-acetylmuramate--L-alanine ligase [Puia sp.]